MSGIEEGLIRSVTRAVEKVDEHPWYRWDKEEPIGDALLQETGSANRLLTETGIFLVQE